MSKTVFGVSELWSELPSLRPLVLYGTGDGADKIIREMERRGLSPDGFFASDGFVRDKLFHDLPVTSLSACEERFGRFTVLAAFGSSRPEVIGNVKSIMSRHALFAPDVPVCGENIFDSAFYEANREKIDRARSLLSDDLSVRTFDSVIKYKLSGELRFLFECETSEPDALSLLSGGYTAYADLGAYTGDTVKTALERYPSVNKVVAFEPARKPFEKLTAFCENSVGVDFSLFNVCASDADGIMTLSDGGGRGSKLSDKSSLSGAKTRPAECSALDIKTNIRGEKLLIKYDVEGAEAKALAGSVRTIKNNDTELSVSLYHRSEDIFDLPITVHGLLPEHRLYIRKLPGFPAWDIILYACI